MVGRPVEQQHAQLALQPSQLLAERGLDNVLAGGRPPEMELIGESHKISKLAKLHRRLPTRSSRRGDCATASISAGRRSTPEVAVRLLSFRMISHASNAPFRQRTGAFD